MLLGSKEGHCFAVEYPNENAYTKDPTAEDFKNFAGLKVVDVTQRFNYVIYSGLGIEGVTLLLVILGLAMGRNKIHDFMGHLSLAWFVALIWVRFDHYGRVCSGDFEGSDAPMFPDMQKAAYFASMYVHLVWYVILGLFSLVLLYSCCVDKPRKATEEDENE